MNLSEVTMIQVYTPTGSKSTKLEYFRDSGVSFFKKKKKCFPVENFKHMPKETEWYNEPLCMRNPSIHS